MSKNHLAVVLDVERESTNQKNEMFYRYLVGDFVLWFSQDMDGGNIFSVGLREQGKELEDFEINVYCKEEGREEKHVGYYPNEFQVRPRSYPMTTQDAYEFMVKMRKACRILDTVEEFFATSKHYELYAKHHFSGEKSVKVEAYPAKGGDALCAQTYPVEAQDEALKMFREEHPEYKGCILTAGFVYGKPLDEKLADASHRSCASQGFGTRVAEFGTREGMDK